MSSSGAASARRLRREGGIEPPPAAGAFSSSGTATTCTSMELAPRSCLPLTPATSRLTEATASFLSIHWASVSILSGSAGTLDAEKGIFAGLR